MRGNRDLARGVGVGVRSIPACAGEPPSHCLQSHGNRVYPRVCGGTLDAQSENGAAHGLSPRVRGNRSAPVASSASTGSIPACAGEPVSDHRRIALIRVYPRVCGGTLRGPQEQSKATGLSPRVRGNHGEPHDVLTHSGSIPACAGEPSISTNAQRATRVYPRVCGEP